MVFGSDRANVGRTYQRPDALRNPNNGPKTPDQWFDTGAFAQTAQPFTYGSSGAFTVEGDGRLYVDLSLGKRFAVSENRYFQLRGEFYNMPNAVKMLDPTVNFSSGTFGKVTTATDARQIQLSLRFTF